MQRGVLKNPVFTLLAYILFLLAAASIFLAIILFVKEAFNTFYTHEMAPGDYLISAAVYLTAGILLLALVYFIRPSILRKNAEGAEEEKVSEESPEESLEDIL